MVELPAKTYPDPVVTVRCTECGGLRGISTRHHGKFSGRCRDCRRGTKRMRREDYYDYWTDRFTMDEIRVMAAAIWGD